MKTLFLCSTGIRKKIIAKEFLKLLLKTPSQTKVAHINTALKAVSDTDFAERERKALKDVGFQVTEIDIEGKNQNELREILSNFDVIYMQGGNGFYLLKHIKESGLDKLLSELLDKGIIYFGASAGAYVACPSIEMHSWKKAKNTFGLFDWSGLNLVPFLIVAHYTDELKEVIIKGIKSTKYSVKILTDQQALIIRDSNYELIGEGEEIILN